MIIINILIITGLSGAGKSLVLRKMEDNGYFCVDNLPLNLVEELILGMQRDSSTSNIALGIDSRNISLSNAKSVVTSLRKMNNKVEIIFLDARDDVLMRRYSETRRNHPMAREGLVEDGISRERKALEQLREISTFYIDTSDTKPAKLYMQIDGMMEETRSDATLMIRSFGFKHGIPPDADIIMDMRFLPNPFWIEKLRSYTGQDRPIIDYVMSFSQTTQFLDSFSDMLIQMLPYYLQEGKPRLLVGIGCTGGQHRSVCLAEELGRRMSIAGIENMVSHRDLDKANK